MPNYIKRIGLELEGGWSSRPPGAEMRRDGSVDLSGSDAQVVGEISSPPYARIETAEEWLIANHPRYTNQTCGFHIHISTETDGLYCRLMCREFFDKFCAAYQAWGDEHLTAQMPERRLFLDRLAGRNRYCLRDFKPDDQAAYQPGVHGDEQRQHRYCLLNYCYKMHGTMESRLLPMFKAPSLSVSAMHCFVNTINSFLDEDMASPQSALEAQLVEDAILFSGVEEVQLPDIIQNHDLFETTTRHSSYTEFLKSIGVKLCA